MKMYINPMLTTLTGILLALSGMTLESIWYFLPIMAVCAINGLGWEQ